MIAHQNDTLVQANTIFLLYSWWQGLLIHYPMIAVTSVHPLSQGSNQVEADQNAAASFVSLAVVDVRNNNPRMLNTDARKTVLPATCRGKSRGGSVGLAVGRREREAKSNVRNSHTEEKMWQFVPGRSYYALHRLVNMHRYQLNT